MKIDEHELEAMHSRERRFERDDEHERFDWARMRPARRPRYSRFRTLAAMTSLWVTTPEEQPADLKEAA
jgi:hypothetical protein